MTDGNGEMGRRDVLKSIGAGALGTAGAAAAGRPVLADDSTSHYHNPVYRPHFPDPGVVRAGDGTYYAFASNMDKDDESKERVIPVIKSQDLVNWTYVGEAFDTKPTWYADDFQLWAPGVAYYDGRYYMYYTAAIWGEPNPGIGVATSDTPEGPYTDHGKVFLSDEIGVDSIDAYFEVVDGTPHLMFGGFGTELHTVELTADGLDWVTGSQQPVAGPGYEAPYVVQRNGYYYLFASRGSCCSGNDSTYHVIVGRSDSFFGPYTNENGVDLLETPDEPRVVESNPRFTGPGHCSAVQDDAGDWWMLYHGYDRDTPGYIDGTYRRELFVDRLRWENGWPTVACYGTPSDRSPMPHSGNYDCSSTGPIPEGTYWIENVNSGKAMDVDGGSTSDGADVIQWGYWGGANQQWNVIQNSDGTYRLENVNSGKVLDVYGGGTSDGDNIIQWDWHGGDNQRWTVIENPDGTYRLENVNSGKVADVDGGSTSDGATVLQWSWWGGDNQKWRFNFLDTL